MKKIILSVLFYFTLYNLSAQTTEIPDPVFEQALITFGIDSDGIVNGEALTSDLENVTELTLDPDNGNSVYISSLSGIEAFSNLQELTITFSEITSLDISNNTQLRMLNCRSNNLTAIDISNNSLLEELHIGNIQDLGPWNQVSEIDLSNNPNINYVEAFHIPTLHTINLKNGNNNTDMYIIFGQDAWFGDPQPEDPLNTVCIQVDSEELAQSNQLPYSEWNIIDVFSEYHFSENCALSNSSFNNNVQLSVYPNPASDNLNINSSENISELSIYNILGQKVKQVKVNSNESTIDVSSLNSGTYIITINTATGSKTEKIVIR